MTRIEVLRYSILKAKHAYYYSDKPIISDQEFDALELELSKLSPNDPVLLMVGSPVPKDSILTKALHAMPMGSQNKVNSEEEFKKWFEKNQVEKIHASLKADGGSAAAYYKNGWIEKVVSRGDGEVGEDITQNALHFQGLPTNIVTKNGGFTGAVRFEVILTIENWSKVDPEKSKNPRNAGNGIMGRKNGSQSNLLTVFAFDLDETDNNEQVVWKTETEKSERLTDLGFNVVQNKTFATVVEAVDYFEHVDQVRSTLPFWIDGVVFKIDNVQKQRELGVSGGCPKGQVAWKFASVGAESVLESVEISGGHTGGLYPTAKFRPVEIGGTTVSSASLANFDEIERLDLAVGDSIFVVKANDIIPKIIKVTHRPPTRQAIEPPSVCPFCGGEVAKKQNSTGEDGVHLVCKNADCDKKSVGKLKRWITSLDILGIGDVLLESLVERFNLQDAADLYTLKDRIDELVDLVTNTDRDLRLGLKRATTILEEIERKRTLSLSQFLGSLGLDYLGKRRVEIMVKAANGHLSTLEDWQSGKLRDQQFAESVGVPGIGSQVQSGIDANKTLIERLLASGVVCEPELVAENNNTVPEKTVCISGVLPSGKKKANYKEPLKNAGYTLVDDVKKGLNFLVLADPASTSAKAKKAQKLGIQIISENDLIDLCCRNAMQKTDVSELTN